MSSTSTFYGSNNIPTEVKRNLRDQSSTKLVGLRAHTRFEFNHASRALENTTDLASAQAINGITLSNLELNEQTAIENGLHLLPASMASYLLRQAKQGSCPPLPILRVLGFCS